jgi:hypothetical protein
VDASKLGTDINTGQLVSLAQEARLRGLYVIGKTGTGKTNLLINLILQDIEQGMGVCFLDTHGDPINDILARIPKGREQDVILLDPLDKDAAFGLNLFECDATDEKQVSRTVSYVLEVFAKLFTKSGVFDTEAVNMELTLRNAAYALIDNLAAYATTLAEMPLLIDDEYARERLIGNINNGFHSEALRFWKRYHGWKMPEQFSMAGSTSRALNRFLTNIFIKQVVGQSRTTLTFRKIMDERKILLVKLSRQDRELTNLIGSIVIGQIANAAFSREDTPEDQRVQFNLYADEYQRFSTPTFAELLAEVRKYKIATCVAHQWRQQLDVDNRKATLNAGTMVVFEVSGEDGEELAKQFKAEPQQQPGRYRHEMKKQPRMEKYKEREWDTEENKKQFEEEKRKLEQFGFGQVTDAMLNDRYQTQGENWVSYMYSLAFSPDANMQGVMEDCIQDAYMSAPFHESIVEQKFFQLFNPDYTDERVQQYLLQHIYAPGSTMQQPVLRNPHQLEYQFPADLPTMAEMRLEQYREPKDLLQLMRASKAEKLLALLRNGEDNIGLEKFEMEHFPGLIKLKQKAVYRFEPKGTLYGIAQLSQCQWEDEEKIQEEAEKRDKAYILLGKELGTRILLRNELSSMVGGADIDTIPELVKLIPPIYSLRKKRIEKKLQECEERMERLREVIGGMNTQWASQSSSSYRKYAAKHAYGYWHLTSFPEVFVWYVSKLSNYKRKSKYQRKRFEEGIQELAEFRREHYIEVEKERPTGDLEPVYTHTPVARGLYTGDEKTPVYELVYEPGLMESPSDAEKRVAKELANPTKKYTAQVKLESGEEHLIAIEETEQFRPAAALSDILVRHQSIVDQTRKLYCKKRTEVEQEIAARQEELTKPIQRKAKAKTGDEQLTPEQLEKLKKSS